MTQQEKNPPHAPPLAVETGIKPPAADAQKPSAQGGLPAGLPQAEAADEPICAQLRRRRIERGLTLEKVREETKITLKFIVALEEGRYSVFPAKVYCRGFFLSYAKYLGFEDAFGLWEQIEGVVPARSGHNSHDVQTPPRRAATPMRAASQDAAKDLGLGARFVFWVTEGQNWILAFIVLPALSLGCFYGIYSYIQHRGYASSPEKMLNIPKILGQKESSRERQSEAVPSFMEDSAPSAKEFVLDISAKSEPTWMRVDVDGRLMFQGILPALQKRTFRGGSTIKMRVGNPKSIQVKANGALWDFSPQDLEKTPLEVEFTPSSIDTMLAPRQ